ncbi:MAG: protein kinase domain-containing protein [Gammaproteobacteria bacterium]
MRLWRWLPGIGIALLLTAAATLQIGRSAESVVARTALLLAPQRPPNPDVVVVAMDSAALQTHGSRPWRRDLFAQLTAQLSADRARVIAYVPAFSAPQNAEALQYLHDLASLDALKKNRYAAHKIAEARAALSTDQAFADSIANAGNVILAAYGVVGRVSAAAPVPPWLNLKMQVPQPEPSMTTAWLFRPESASLDPPLEVLGQAAGGIGWLSESPPADSHALMVEVRGQLLPGFALLVAARDLGLSNDDIVAHASGGISLGDEYLFTDAQLRAQLRRYPGGAGRSAIPVYDFDAVLYGLVPAENLAGKTVIVGPSGGDALAAAAAVSRILNNDLVAAPWWAWALRALLTLLVGVYLTVMLSRMRRWPVLVASVLFLIVLVNAEFIPLLARGVWLPLILPILFLVVGYALVTTLQWLQEWHGVPNTEFSETNRQLALACQALGRYHDALTYFGKCLPSAALHENLLHLGHEHERHRRYPEAIEVYTEMERRMPEFGSVAERLRKLQALDRQSALTRVRTGGPILLTDDGLQKPVLGRYQLLRELGRGAMSVVYLGSDQKINRTVAIKTLNFANEFSGSMQQDVIRRFFREAETAGQLNHPNIVTIYDVGEDQGLAYIAMDYVAGIPLQDYAVPGSLLPIEEVLAIVIKIAEALDYAHARGVVHRDIKPANILYERDTGRLKITDFGVAGVLNASKTRTGTILGSPSYMSPEQVGGGKVDGRSDLYSLGVTLYQLLRGELPFEAPTLTGLMFKVANSAPPDVSFLRPDISPVLKELVDRMLQKKLDARFQTGAELANAVRQCRGRARRAG